MKKLIAKYEKNDGTVRQIKGVIIQEPLKYEKKLDDYFVLDLEMLNPKEIDVLIKAYSKIQQKQNEINKLETSIKPITSKCIRRLKPAKLINPEIFTPQSAVTMEPGLRKKKRKK